MKRQRQRGGAIVILVSQVSVALAILAIFTLYVGRWLNQQEESGNQADALSLAAMEIARNEGISNIRQLCAHPAMQRLLHDLNGNRTAQFRGDCGRFVEIRNPDGTITLHFQVNTQSELEVGPLAERYVRGQVFPLQATAKAAITQENFDEAERRRYKLVLVLDYSGSMNERGLWWRRKPASTCPQASGQRPARSRLRDRLRHGDVSPAMSSHSVSHRPQRHPATSETRSAAGADGSTELQRRHQRHPGPVQRRRRLR
jgi:hypothetical protein